MNNIVEEGRRTIAGGEYVTFTAYGRDHSIYLYFNKSGRYFMRLSELDQVCRALRIGDFSELGLEPGIPAIDVYAGRIYFGTLFPGFFICTC